MLFTLKKKITHLCVNKTTNGKINQPIAMILVCSEYKLKRINLYISLLSSQWSIDGGA